MLRPLRPDDFERQRLQLLAVKKHSSNIANCVNSLSDALQDFIQFMKPQKMTLPQLRLAQKVFNGSIRDSITNKGYARNVLYTVWDVLFRNKFELFRLNCSDNQKLNFEALAVGTQPMLPKRRRHQQITVQLEEESTAADDPKDLCIICSEHGFLVECSFVIETGTDKICGVSAHPQCVGLVGATRNTLVLRHPSGATKKTRLKQHTLPSLARAPNPPRRGRTRKRTALSWMQRADVLKSQERILLSLSHKHPLRSVQLKEKVVLYSHQ